MPPASDTSSREGIEAEVGLKELYRRGLPKPSHTLRSRVNFNFSQLELVDSESYYSQFGIKIPVHWDGSHQVFRLVIDDQPFLIPALVLMRALFTPSQFLLDNMFRPSGLDRVCHLNYVGDIAEIVLHAAWATSRSSKKPEHWKNALGWMTAYPSATVMVDSIHVEAMRGTIGLHAPMGTLNIILSGIKPAATFLATAANVMSVSPDEAAIIKIKGLEGTIALHGRKLKGTTYGGRSVKMDIPRQDDGSTALTNDEWSAVEPILLSRRLSAQRATSSRRATLDAILAKLSSGESWQRATVNAGHWRTVAHAYEAWKRRGTFSEVLAVLTEFRQLAASGSGASSPS